MKGSLSKGRLFAWLFVVMALLVGCGPPSAEDMEKQWHSSEENAQKYAAKYPGFKTALDDLLKSTKAEFDEAKKGDEKTRGEKMKVPVDKVSSSIKIFETYEAESDKLSKLLKDKDLNELPASKFNAVADPAKEALKKAEAMLKDSKPANMGEAKAKLEEAIKSLQASSKALEALKPAKPSGGNTSSPAANTSSPGSTSSPATTSSP
ncbi:MAG: hypothetical protein HOW73_25480 [Polyangiaceae bacterium]|nr:hypothetical protein [Polyangiaceae bacterium]